jgi:hypothetical protein
MKDVDNFITMLHNAHKGFEYNNLDFNNSRTEITLQAENAKVVFVFSKDGNLLDIETNSNFNINIKSTIK